jgi:hypothetical protein
MAPELGAPLQSPVTLEGQTDRIVSRGFKF